jgi:hypothetical protein
MKELHKFMQSKGIKKVTADQLIPFTAMGVNESV